jgi:hypothetical protein
VEEQAPTAPPAVPGNASQAASPSRPESVAARSSSPIRLAALDGGTNYFPKLTSREARIEIVKPIDNPDLIWDPKSRDVISWGDVVAYKVDQSDLATVIDRTAALRELKKIATKAPQAVRVAPDDAQHRGGDAVQIELSDITNRSVILFDISGDGTVQMLYPVGSDAPVAQVASLRLPLRVREPFGAEQVVAITSTERLPALEEALRQLNQRRAPGQVVKIMTKLLTADARVGSVGFFTAP